MIRLIFALIACASAQAATFTDSGMSFQLCDISSFVCSDLVQTTPDIWSGFAPDGSGPFSVGFTPLYEDAGVSFLMEANAPRVGTVFDHSFFSGTGRRTYTETVSGTLTINGSTGTGTVEQWWPGGFSGGTSLCVEGGLCTYQLNAPLTFTFGQPIPYTITISMGIEPSSTVYFFHGAALVHMYPLSVRDANGQFVDASVTYDSMVIAPEPGSMPIVAILSALLIYRRARWQITTYDQPLASP